MPGKRIGYIRVSTIEQNISRQLEGVELDRKFIDKLSGKNCSREQLQSMIGYIREGDADQVFVHSMDRLARSSRDLQDIVDAIIKKKASITFVKEGLTLSGDDSPFSMLMLKLFAAFAEFEYTLSLERQREGIAIAKARGAYKGRKKVLNPEIEKQIIEMSKLGGITKSYIARRFKVSRGTVYGCLKNAG